MSLFHLKCTMSERGVAQDQLFIKRLLKIELLWVRRLFYWYFYIISFFFFCLNVILHMKIKYRRNNMHNIQPETSHVASSPPAGKFIQKAFSISSPVQTWSLRMRNHTPPDTFRFINFLSYFKAASLPHSTSSFEQTQAFTVFTSEQKWKLKEGTQTQRLGKGKEGWITDRVFERWASGSLKHDECSMLTNE